MFRIAVSMDMDNVKDDFVLGFSFREVVFGIVSVLMSCGLIAFLIIVCKLPIYIVAYIAIPIVSPIALIGFSKKYEMYYDERKKEDYYCRKNSRMLFTEMDTEEEKLLHKTILHETDRFHLIATEETGQERKSLLQHKIVTKLLMIPKEQRMNVLLGEKNKQFRVVEELPLEWDGEKTNYRLLHIEYKKKIQFDFLICDGEIYEPVEMAPYIFSYFNFDYVKRKRK